MHFNLQLYDKNTIKYKREIEFLEALFVAVINCPVSG